MTNSIIDQKAAVSILSTDSIWLWQPGQSPSSRRATLAEVSVFSLPLTGGTLTGKLTLSVAGTALVVNNNATIGGTLVTTGAVTLNGGTTLSADGGWSSANVGKQLLITTPTGHSNPGIAIPDSANTNLLGIYNTTGTLSISSMPAYSNSASAPTTILTATSGAVTVTGTLKTSGATTVTSGGLTITAGGVTVTAGGATVTAGDVAVTAGNILMGAGTIVLPNAVSITQKDKGGTNRSLLEVDNSNNTLLFNAGGGNLSLTNQAGTALLTTSDAGAFALTGSMSISTDATNSRLVPNYSQFAPTLGNPGAIANPGGYLSKWGKVTTGVLGTFTITFAVAFPTACDSIVLTVDGQGFAASLIGAPSASAANIISYDVLTTNGTAKDVYWFAIGH